jgi:hypothetical protein
MKVGAAIRDITPKKATFLVGFPHIERISEGVHDPLLASALYLHSGTAEAVLIALDILFIDPSMARGLHQRVSKGTGIPQEAVFISCSHTHSGPHTAYVLEWGPSPVVPDVDPDYMEFMAGSVVAAATDAARNSRNADVAWCAVDVNGVGGNRHEPGKGFRDPEVGNLLVRAVLDLAYNLDILSQLPDGLFAAKPCGALTDYMRGHGRFGQRGRNLTY